MGKFLESERLEQAHFKAASPYFSDQAKEQGIYNHKPRPFCLPVDGARENLVPEIRETAPAWFAGHGIKWHDGQNGNPSNHLCDSQVCCVNFLFPFDRQPAALKHLLLPVFPEINRMLPVEDGSYVSFEWIGAQNYLGEKIAAGGTRTRGANFTSSDAIVMFEKKDGKKQILLVEWKYTESYPGNNLKYSKRGTDRTGIYRHLIEKPDCPVDVKHIPSFDALFFEPFYQFMRQQLLANEMEKAHELGADTVSLLHICPAHNTDFRKITSPGLVDLGESALSVWKKLVRVDGRFISVQTEDLFGRFIQDQIPEMSAWGDYIRQRYRWVESY